MTVTMKMTPDRMSAYFDTFTKRFLRDDSPEAVNVEVLDPELGEQFVAEGVRLLGITYDRHTNALEFAIEAGDHRVFHPTEVWTVEEPDGFIDAIEVVDADGARQIVTVRRVGQQGAT